MVAIGILSFSGHVYFSKKYITLDSIDEENIDMNFFIDLEKLMISCNTYSLIEQEINMNIKYLFLELN